MFVVRNTVLYVLVVIHVVVIHDVYILQTRLNARRVLI